MDLAVCLPRERVASGTGFPDARSFERRVGFEFQKQEIYFTRVKGGLTKRRSR